jgi:NAD(P)H-hydrate epimerase
MVGAPALSAIGALRAGAGLAKLVMPEPVIVAGLTIAPSATGIVLPVERTGEVIAHEGSAVLDGAIAECNCLAIGPGFGVSAGTRALVLRAVQQETVPVVVDADAINALADVAELTRDFRAAAVVTPHPGEYRRMAESLSLDENPTGDESARRHACEGMARRLGAVVVLKGAHTVVSDGHHTWVNDVSCDALATAGTGDVLTGIIAGLIAQFVAIKAHPMLPDATDKPLSLYDAARLGVRAHVLAGRRWVDRKGESSGLLAKELAREVSGVLEGMRG